MAVADAVGVWVAVAGAFSARVVPGAYGRVGAGAGDRGAGARFAGCAGGALGDVSFVDWILGEAWDSLGRSMVGLWARLLTA